MVDNNVFVTGMQGGVSIVSNANVCTGGVVLGHVEWMIREFIPILLSGSLGYGFAH